MTYPNKNHSRTWNRCVYLHLVLLILSIIPALDLQAKARPPIGCSIAGASPVTVGGTYTYTLNGPCTATGWTTTCGTIQSYTSTSVSIYFNQTSCSSAQIAATGTTATLTVTVNQPPPLNGGTISNPSQAINYGATPALISASNASGDNCPGGYTYQWFYSTDGVGFTAITGATGLNYQPGALTVTTYYKRMTLCFTNAFTDNTATVTVYPQLVPGSVNPPSMYINYNTSPGSLSVTGVSGGNGIYTYRWLNSCCPTGFGVISGETGSTYSPGNLTSTVYYQVEVTSNGVITYSNYGVVNVYPQLTSGAISPSSQAINYNTAPATMTVTGVSGGSGIYTYQWYSNASGSFQPIGGPTGSSYSPGALTTTTSYYAMVSSNGVSATTGTVTVTVYPQLVSGSISPASQTIPYNTLPSALSLSGTSGGTGTYTYLWYSNASGSYQPIWGPTDPIYPPFALTATTSYEVVTSSNGASVTSAPVTITVMPQLLPGSIATYAMTISPGSSPGILTANAASGGNCGGNYTYLWQQSADRTNWGTAGGVSNGQNYTPGPLNATTYFRRQAVCGTETAYTNIALITVGASSADMNYMRTRDIARPGVTDTVTANQLTDPNDVKQVMQYFDGLGRPVQTVAKRISPLGNDMVSLVAYDPFDRESTKYLPFTSSSNDGNYKLYSLQEQNVFNMGQFPGEQYYYGQTGYEPSPLNRPLNTYPAGLSWEGSNRGISLQYPFNDATDSVLMWNIALAARSLPVTGGYYSAGQLDKNVTIDEQSQQTVEYKDKEGRTVLKKVQFWSNPASGPSGWLNTYYVYDDVGNLRFVIQPKAVDWLKVNGWNFAAAGGNQVDSELCFSYEYDQRNRLSLKKVPGAGAIWMIYDSRDRLVMTQDANLRTANQWLVTQYDGLNRPVETGLMTYATTQSALQQLVSTQTSGSYVLLLPADTTLTGPNTIGDVQAVRSVTLDTGFSSSDTGSFTGEIVNGSWGNGGSVTNNVSINNSPVPPGVVLQPLTITYYDEYSWVAGTKTTLSPTFSGANANYFITSYNTGPAYAVPIAAYPVTRGQVTGTQTLVLGTDNKYLYAVNFYDDRGRVIQSQSINYTGGMDTLTTQYNFGGKPLRTLLGQAKRTNTTQVHQVLTKTNYDAGFRVTSIWKNIDAAAADQLIDSMQYNELGQLRAKYLGNNLDSVVYDYNIRGWVTGINRDYIRGTANHYFGMELGYDNAGSVAGTSYSNPAFNGNIAGTVWKSAGDRISRKYDFTYDNVNRLTGASYLDNSSGTGWDNKKMDYTVSGLTYDANGNIQFMRQNGYRIGNPTGAIDSLVYSYQANSNKLAQVTDGDNDPTSQLGDFHYTTKGGGYDYSYDGNGSLTKDNNKAIDTISYNYLNLPQQVHMNGKGNIVYTYDAAGNKLQKQVFDSVAGLASTTLYLDGFQYQRRMSIANSGGGVDTLQFLGHEEGRARWAFHKHLAGDSACAWEYDFMERDHLGNTRVLLTQERDTAQYLATMEAKYRSTEDSLFYGIDSSCIARSSVRGYPNDLNYTNPNDSVARVNGNGPKVGPAIILKVMSGDSVDLGVQYYYQSTGSGSGKNLTAQDLLTSLAAGLASLSPTAHAGFSSLSNNTNSPLLPALNSALANDTGTASNKPQAYLNWVLLDNQFNYVGGNNQSGALQVLAADTQSNGQLQAPLAYKKLPITKSGYLYIYVSNATPGWDVFFDNLSVRHYSGSMLEENHYYPFGLTMAGISDKALKSNYAENKYRFQKQELQNKEFSDGSGLEMYEFKYRFDDPQIGRFWSIDPLASKYVYNSPYAFSENKVINSVELEGLEAVLIIQKAKQELAEAFQAAANWVDNTFSIYTKTSASTEVQSGPLTKTSVGTSITTTTTTNAGGNMNYLIAHNTNQGNPEPATKTTTTVSADVKTETTTPIVSISKKGSIDNQGVVTNETSAKGTVPIDGIPVTFTGSATTGSDGKNKVTIQATAGTSNAQGGVNMQYGTDGKKQSIFVGAAGEGKAGNTKVTTQAGMKVTF